MRAFTLTLFRRTLALSLVALTGAGCGSDMSGPAGDASAGTDTLSPGAADGDDVSTEGDAPAPSDTTASDTSRPDTSVPDAQNPDTSPKLVQIVAPADGATVRGVTTVKLVPVGIDEREVDAVTLKVNGVKVFTDLKLPTEIQLDTRQHGRMPLELLAEAEDGFDEGSHKIRVTPDNPPIAFIEVTPREPQIKNGDVIGLTLNIEGPPDIKLSADLSALDSAYAPGQETFYPLGANTYAMTYIVSSGNTRRDGVYTVPVKATIANWEVNYGQLQLNLRNGATAPVFVEGGIFVDAPLPASTQTLSAPPSLALSNNTIVTGGASELEVGWAAGEANRAVGVIIGLEGHTGYYQVPLDDQRFSQGTVAALLRVRAYQEWEVPPSTLPLRVALRDAQGRVSEYAEAQATLTRVGTGDIQVSLSWDTPTDVDLYVVDPYGCELYYGNTTDDGGGGWGEDTSECRGFGGQLDLDSNPGCSIDGVQNENVFWPPGAAPEGVYTVRANFYSDCCSCGANYTATVSYCGKTEVYEGKFTPDADTPGGSGMGTVVARFDNRNCSRTVTGRVRYQDRTFDKQGFGGLQWRTLEGLVVELRRIQTNEVIGTGTTDRNGVYRIPFPEVPGLVVAVKAQTDPKEGLRDIKVYDHPKFKRLYEVTSPPIILYPNQEVVEQNMDITIDQKAGAFNILDVMRRGYDLVRLAAGKELGELRAFWATGADTTDTLFCSKYLFENGACTELDSVSVQGKETDRDEYDDMVILKEFFKFALGRLSRDSHPGGNVDGRRDDSRRAWTEGVAHFFAADVLASRHFVNSRPFGVYIVDDLEAMPSPFGLKTQGGKVSHYLVAAALWDLADSNNETWDGIDRQRAAIYDVLFSHLPSSRYSDRGETGVDLTDFLDGWRCRGWASDEALRALIVDHYQFSYDFAGSTCTE
jgi:hypothetical protein